MFPNPFRMLPFSFATLAWLPHTPYPDLSLHRLSRTNPRLQNSSGTRGVARLSFVEFSCLRQHSLRLFVQKPLCAFLVRSAPTNAPPEVRSSTARPFAQ